jgi:ubiquinone/menaquinone biosynthesis C-methylase UbiE
VEEKVVLVKSDITDMKEPESDSFDFVFSQYDAVSYCMKPAKAIRELGRVARKGAKLEANPEIQNRLLQIELAYCTDKSLDNFAGHLQTVGQIARLEHTVRVNAFRRFFF